MYLSAWIWCRDEHKKGGGGVHKIRTRALGVAQFSRFVPSARAILDAAKNDLKEPRGYTKSTRVPHMPKDATGAVAEVAVAMRGKKPKEKREGETGGRNGSPHAAGSLAVAQPKRIALILRFIAAV